MIHILCIIFHFSVALMVMIVYCIVILLVESELCSELGSHCGTGRRSEKYDWDDKCRAGVPCQDVCASVLMVEEEQINVLRGEGLSTWGAETAALS